MTMFIKNLPHQASQVDLLKLFEKYGLVKSVVVPTDRTNKVIGFAFVEMSERTQELLAVSELNGAKWIGCQLQVRISHLSTTSTLNCYA